MGLLDLDHEELWGCLDKAESFVLDNIGVDSGYHLLTTFRCIDP